MQKKFDISWKDFLAVIAGYFTAVVCVGALYLMMGLLVIQGNETAWAQYENPIAIATCIAFALGGGVLTGIRPTTATRNATVLFVGLIVYGIWRMNPAEANVQDTSFAALQVAGIFLGVWLMQKRAIIPKK